MRQHDIKCAYYPNWQQHHQHEKHESSLPKQQQQSSPSIKDHCNAIPAQLACLYFFIFRPNAKRYATTSLHFLHLHASLFSFSDPILGHISPTQKHAEACKYTTHDYQISIVTHFYWLSNVSSKLKIILLWGWLSHYSILSSLTF